MNQGFYVQISLSEPCWTLYVTPMGLTPIFLTSTSGLGVALWLEFNLGIDRGEPTFSGDRITSIFSSVIVRSLPS